MADTLCWNCNHAYPFEGLACPQCNELNPNHLTEQQLHELNERIIGNRTMNTTKKFDVHYYSNKRGEGRKLSHTYNETWTLTELYCLACGKQSVWACDAADLELGAQHMCTSCHHSFYVPDDPWPPTDEFDKQRLAGLTGN